MIPPEVVVRIRLADYTLLQERFETCEKAWAWDRNMRRSKDVVCSAYAGITRTGVCYGGPLKDGPGVQGLLEDIVMDEEMGFFKRHNAYARRTDFLKAKLPNAA